MSNKQTSFTHEYLDDDGVIQTGTFTVKRLSIMERSKMAVRRSQLGGGMYCVRNDEGDPTGQGLDPETDFVNHMIAHLELSLAQKPSWFKLDEITDFGVLTALFDKVTEFEQTFFRRRDQPAADESRDSSSGEKDSGVKHSQQNASTTATKVVGQEVQASLDA